MKNKPELKHCCGGGIVKSRTTKDVWYCVKCGKTWPYYPNEEGDQIADTLTRENGEHISGYTRDMGGRLPMASDFNSGNEFKAEKL